jgi:hypothetical protein
MQAACERERRGCHAAEDGSPRRNRLEIHSAGQNSPPPRCEAMLGLKFCKTTYTAASRKQTLHSALKDGAKISIALIGADRETDPTIHAVLKSVTLK